MAHWTFKWPFSHSVSYLPGNTADRLSIAGNYHTHINLLQIICNWCSHENMWYVRRGGWCVNGQLNCFQATHFILNSQEMVPSMSNCSKFLELLRQVGIAQFCWMEFWQVARTWAECLPFVVYPSYFLFFFICYAFYFFSALFFFFCCHYISPSLELLHLCHWYRGIFEWNYGTSISMAMCCTWVAHTHNQYPICIYLDSTPELNGLFGSS